MKNNVFVLILFFSFSISIHAQLSSAELLVKDTQYEYLLKDTSFVAVCEAAIPVDSAEIKINNLTDDDRKLTIYVLCSEAVLHCIDTDNTNTINNDIVNAKNRITELEKEAKQVLTKKNYKEYKKTNSIVIIGLNMMKMLSGLTD